MKLAAAILLLVALTWSGQSFAGSENSNKDHAKNQNNGNGNGGNNGNSGNSNNGNTGKGHGGDSGGGNSEGGGANGNGKGKGGESGNKSAPSGGASGSAVRAPGGASDQDDALGAVQSGQALPLARITSIAEAKWGGRVIDAELLRARGALLYRLTILSDSGVSRRVYYQAATGQPVGKP